MTASRIGVDLGGTKIEAVVVELDAPGATPAGEGQPRELARARVATNRTLGYEHVVSATRDLVLEVARAAGIDPVATPIGVGMPGSVTMRRADGERSDQPLVKNSNTTCLNGQPFHADLAAAIGRSVVFANDANCFALAEATWGAARGARVAFGVIMGTGVGGGLVIAPGLGPRAAKRGAGLTLETREAGRGMGQSPMLETPRAWNGAQGIAGEWGHVALEPERGPECYCGRRGCVETYLSGPAIEAEYARRAGTTRKLAEVAALAASGEDAVARELIAERVEIFGRALATVINVVDPDIIVLGGGVSNLAVLYEEGVQAVARWTFNDDLVTRIVKHALGDSAGVLGAALLP